MTRRCAVDSDAPWPRQRSSPWRLNTPATSSPSRVTFSSLRKASVASPLVRWGRAAAADRADWRWRRPYWWRFEDIEPWCSDFDDQAATEWSAHRFPIRANGQQRRGDHADIG